MEIILLSAMFFVGPTGSRHLGEMKTLVSLIQNREEQGTLHDFSEMLNAQLKEN